MFALSWSTFRERWQLFLGSILTVGIGVALVQSSLLILVTAATFTPSAGLSFLERAQVMDHYVLAIPVVGITLALALFLTIFIVSSTFAFTVAQRRRDLALLRLTGGSRKQVRRLLLSEATLLGLVGTAIGVPLGLLLIRVQTWLLVSFDFLPAGFHPEWRSWILAVSVGIGLAVALAGVLVASRRAGRVRPLEALRGTGAEARVMTAPRWFFGVVFLAIAAVLTVTAQVVDPSGAMPLTMLVSLAAAVGLSALSPVVVPLLGRILRLLLRRTGPVGAIATANVRDGVRRNAATAAPLIMLVGIVVGLLGTSFSLTEASEQTLRRDTTADLVVTSSLHDAGGIDRVPGVASTSVETDVPLVITDLERSDDLAGDQESATARVVDAGDYRQAHRLRATAGSLDALHGHAVALGPGRSGELGLSLGDTIHLRIGDRQVTLPIVAVLPTTTYGGADLLLPKGIVPESALTSASTQTFVSTTGGTEDGAVGDDIGAAIPGTVESASAWVQHHAEAEQNTQLRIFTVLLGMAGLYALFAAINAVVIAAAARRAEFATARLSGLTRRQVVRMAVLESATVTAIGVGLGGVAAAGAILGMRGALERMTGSGVIDLPWMAIGALVAGAFLVTGLTSLWTARSATRTNPVSLVGAD